VVLYPCKVYENGIILRHVCHTLCSVVVENEINVEL
jgi:hypothetical protein